MCKKHKKKIHLRQICGFHLNLFMASYPHVCVQLPYYGAYIIK